MRSTSTFHAIHISSFSNHSAFWPCNLSFCLQYTKIYITANSKFWQSLTVSYSIHINHFNTQDFKYVCCLLCNVFEYVCSLFIHILRTYFLFYIYIYLRVYISYIIHIYKYVNCLFYAYNLYCSYFSVGILPILHIFNYVYTHLMHIVTYIYSLVRTYFSVRILPILCIHF